MPCFLNLIAQLLLGFACGSVDLLGRSLNIRLDLLANLIGLLFQKLFSSLIVQPFLVPSAPRQLISHLIDGSFDPLLSRFTLGQRIGRWGPCRRLGNLSLQPLQLALQLIELLLGRLDLLAGQGCHRIRCIEIGSLSRFGPLLGLFGVLGYLLCGLRKLLGRIGSLHRLKQLSGLLIDLGLQSCVVGFLLECLERFSSLGVFLLQFPIAPF